MAITSSGAISLSNIQSEFGGVNPISLSEYYRNGAYIPSGATSVPTSGAIGISDFYGTSNSYGFSIAANTLNADVRALAITDGWDESTPLLVTVNTGVWCYSDTLSTGGMVLAGSFPGGVTVTNSGNIIGMGGWAGQAGGTALQITTSDTVSITNNSGAYIAGGGGGGSVTKNGLNVGGGGAGQTGDFGDTSARIGGWVSYYVNGFLGAGCTSSRSNQGFQGGPSTVRSYGYGGGGGSGQTAQQSYVCLTPASSQGNVETTYYTASGAAGGRALTGGSNGAPSVGAGGFWGQAGSGGGAGGAAISGTYASYTNNGTVYGAVV